MYDTGPRPFQRERARPCEKLRLIVSDVESGHSTGLAFEGLAVRSLA